jgi:hypothetical protein
MLNKTATFERGWPFKNWTVEKSATFERGSALQKLDAQKKMPDWSEPLSNFNSGGIFDEFSRKKSRDPIAPLAITAQLRFPICITFNQDSTESIGWWIWLVLHKLPLGRILHFFGFFCDPRTLSLTFHVAGSVTCQFPPHSSRY